MSSISRGGNFPPLFYLHALAVRVIVNAGCNLLF